MIPDWVFYWVAFIVLALVIGFALPVTPERDPE